MQAAEILFLFSSLLQLWLVHGAGMVLDHLTCATQPDLPAQSASPAQRFPTQLVVSQQHRLTRLGMCPQLCTAPGAETHVSLHALRLCTNTPSVPCAGPPCSTALTVCSCAALAAQATSSLMLTLALTVSMLLAGAPLLLDVIVVAFRLLLFACNAAFMWEATQSWKWESAVKKGVGRGATSTAIDTELYLLLSCLLFLVWQVLHTCVSSGSVPLLAVLVGIHAGGAALLRTFGAALLMWTPSALAPQTSEACKIHAQLQAWWPPCLQNQGHENVASSGKATAAGPRPPGFSSEYLAAVSTAAAKLMAPSTLFRAQALQDMRSCRTSARLLLLSTCCEDSAERHDPALLHMVRNCHVVGLCGRVYGFERDPELSRVGNP